MRGENDGVILAKRTDQVTDLDDLLGVKADGRLVKNDDGGIAHQSLCDTHALAVALREVADQALVNVLDLHDLADLLQVLGAVERAALKVVNEDQILLYGHIQVKRGLLGQIADAALDLKRLIQHVEPIHQHATRRAGEIPRQNIHRRALAGTVGAKQTDDLATLDLEADVVHGAVGAVVFNQMVDFNHKDLFLSQFCRACARWITYSIIIT